jgi:hypothetical protein
MEQAHQALVEGVQQLTSSQDWIDVLNLSARLPEYSPRNCLLLAVQGAQGLVMGYHAWRKIPAQDGGTCQVKRGAHGLKILAPVTRTGPEVDEVTGQETKVTRMVGFKLISVFDETALASPPALPDPVSLLPQLLDAEAPHQLWDALAAQVQAAGFRLDTSDSVIARIAPTNGLTDHEIQAVAVRPDLPAAQRVKTLAHELAHVHLHTPEAIPEGMPREVAEVEAESVAFLLTAELGLDTSAYTIPYVTGWARGDTALILSTADRVVKTARQISDAVTAHLHGPSPAPAEPSQPTGTSSPEIPQPQPGSAADAGEDLRRLYDSAAPGPTGGEPTATRTAGRADQDAVTIATPTGAWQITWQPERGSFTAQHHTLARTNDGPAEDVRTVTAEGGSDRPDADPGDIPHVTRVIGALPQEITSLGALEQDLGFLLPHVAGQHLTAVQAARPAALAGGRNFTDLYPGDRDTIAALDETELPDPDGGVQIRSGGRTVTALTYQAALATDPRPLRTFTRAGFTVQILTADEDLDPEFSGQQALTYRLTHQGRVMFSGNDILAPLDVDPAGDTAIRQVVALLCRQDDVPLSAAQTQFLRANTETLEHITRLPEPPYPAGTRVAVTRPGSAQAPVTGVVVEAISHADGPVTSYAWRPDAADRPGHPWHDNPALSIVSTTDSVNATLSDPDLALALNETPRQAVIAARGAPTRAPSAPTPGPETPSTATSPKTSPAPAPAEPIAGQSVPGPEGHDAPARSCATPDCPDTAQASVFVGWPTGRTEISQRCTPCAARAAVAGLPRGCTVDIRPLRAPAISATESPIPPAPQATSLGAVL